MSVRSMTIAAGFASVGCATPIFLILFFPLAPVFFIIGVIVAIAGFFKKGNEFTCRECQEKFHLNK